MPRKSAKATLISPAPQQAKLLPDTPPETHEWYAPLADLPPDDQLEGPPPSRDLLESIRRFGPLTPILLHVDGDRITVLAGRRRIKAARQLGLTEIRATSIAVDGAIPSTLTVADHAVRRDNAIADLAAIERLLAAGANETRIAQATGLSRSAIRHRLRLKALSPALLALYREGRVTLNAAIGASRLSVAVQDRLAAQLTATKRLTSRDIAIERRAGVAATVANLPFARIDAVPATTDEPVSYVVPGGHPDLIDCWPAVRKAAEALLRHVDRHLSRAQDPAMARAATALRAAVATADGRRTQDVAVAAPVVAGANTEPGESPLTGEELATFFSGPKEELQ